MITNGQRQQIFDQLRRKNLPVDLKLEISDHMEEQVEYKINFEYKNFETALSETFREWAEPLKMKFKIIGMASRTKVHSDILKETERKLLFRSLKYFALPFLLAVLLLLSDKTWAYYYILILNLSCVIAGVAILIFDFSTIKTTFSNYKMNLSYLKDGTQLLTTSSIFIVSLVLLNYTERFEKFYSAFTHLFNLNFTVENLAYPIIMFVYILFTIYGLLFYLEYKKTISQIKKKINLKL